MTYFSDWEIDVGLGVDYPTRVPVEFDFEMGNDSVLTPRDGSGDGFETNFTSVGESVLEQREVSVGFVLLYVFLTTMTIITVLGNCLVILAVATTRRLRSVTNCFIVSLSVADLLVGGLVMPLSLVYETLGMWPFGRIMCELWTSLDVMLCTASILNLCCISLDRYFAITRPLTYTVKRNKRMALGMIMVVWFASAAVTCPPLLGWYSRDLQDGAHCRYVSAKGYVIYSACGSFYIPLVVMLFVYTRIFIVIYRRNKVVKNQKHYQKPACANGCASTDDVSRSTKNPAVKLHPMKYSEDFSLRDFRLSNSDCLVSMEMVSDSLLAIRPRRESEHMRDVDPTRPPTKGNLYRSRSYQFQFNTSHNAQQANSNCHKLVTTTLSNPSSSSSPSQKKCVSSRTAAAAAATAAENNLLTVPQWSHCPPKNPVKTPSSSTTATSSVNLNATSSTSTRSVYHESSLLYPPTSSVAEVDHRGKPKLSLPALGLAEGETTTLLRATRPSKDFRRKHVRGLRMSFRKETKATTTIAVVVGGFVVCWMPFFIIYIAEPFCDCFISPMLFLGLTWLGWANSAVNPFIYAFYNMDFRAAFWKLTFGRCRKEDHKGKTVVVYPQVWRSRLKGARANGIPSIVMVQSDVM